MPKTRVRNCHEGSRSDAPGVSEVRANGLVLVSDWEVRARLSLGGIRSDKRGAKRGVERGGMAAEGARTRRASSIP
jgi:hypothetical protein